jgi:hypothetical protein
MLVSVNWFPCAICETMPKILAQAVRRALQWRRPVGPFPLRRRVKTFSTAKKAVADAGVGRSAKLVDTRYLDAVMPPRGDRRA